MPFCSPQFNIFGLESHLYHNTIKSSACMYVFMYACMCIYVCPLTLRQFGGFPSDLGEWCISHPNNIYTIFCSRKLKVKVTMRSKFKFIFSAIYQSVFEQEQKFKNKVVYVLGHRYIGNFLRWCHFPFWNVSLYQLSMGILLLC